MSHILTLQFSQTSLSAVISPSADYSALKSNTTSQYINKIYEIAVKIFAVFCFTNIVQKMLCGINSLSNQIR